MQASQKTRDRDQLLAHILLFVTPAMFATNMLMARATTDLIPPVAQAFWRWLGVCLLLLPFCYRELWHHRAALKRELPQLLVLGALGMGICGALVYMGGATTTATNIGLIYSTSPVMVILLSRFWFGERMSQRQVLGVTLALAGVLFIILKGAPDALRHLSFTPGDGLILISSIAWALYSVLLLRWKSALRLTARLAAIAACGVLVMLPFLGWETIAIGPANFGDWRVSAALATLVLVPGLGAYGTFGFINQHLGPSRTGLMLYAAPIYTSVMAWLLLGEAFLFYHWAGAALVLCGLFLATHKPAK
ncbi:DMT family transporter [Ferrovibrio sp.]|uniref:DMT family transporter n=1 Tax=Ferrovibrio sp. TaxID=1917215 RepID=UPI0035AE6EF1